MLAKTLSLLDNPTLTTLNGFFKVILLFLRNTSFFRLVVLCVHVRLGTQLRDGSVKQVLLVFFFEILAAR